MSKWVRTTLEQFDDSSDTKFLAAVIFASIASVIVFAFALVV